MAIAEMMLAEFEQELGITRRFLERVPEEKLGWRVHEKSHSAGELAMHIAVVPRGVLGMGLADKAELPDTSQLWPQPKTVAEILTALEGTAGFVREKLPGISDARMGEMWSGLRNGTAVVTMPRGIFLRMILMNHWIQHRGQLGVYLRLMGAKVPSSYGPSGDEEPGGQPRE